ncbi:MAG: hypothetical protein A2172_02295 [Candidatus Woykebacteria bacterium RBG_13_40_15]|uniref:Uncharacterized protein n=1 Tax=Candidatus Woykebacteria bacterium RBG_13_40_15 TaxID=1802593 RepID=A0A1G1W677_9BACT|nr:MAG: hypothetical protein A2172_02295 [Candidatus Woykebacteria bacterium RBG_13_40_15]
MEKAEKEKLRIKYGITEEDEKPYLMPKEEDYAILAKVKELESKNLSPADRELVSLIRTQLLDDWRTPLLGKLNEILGKYP